MTTTTGDALASDSPERQRRFEALLREHRRIVFHVARTYAGNTDERHDLVQEICSQLWRAFPRYDESRRFSTWMYRIALNTGISHLRQAGARAARFEALSDEVLEATLDDAAPAETAERLAELEARIEQLGPLDRALILLYLEDRSYAEIADVLGISETNVATKISRIKQRFRQQMTGAANS
ncbi:MAG: sigma-70 family RNA polymerase sigma factor [Burkholderiales bacterium]|nr:sigma-70 family RNA polymerase sigma factor [Burkholderiales bacterium]